jgi:hypothetical protein
MTDFASPGFRSKSQRGGAAAMRLLIAAYKEPLLRAIWRQRCFSLLRRRVWERLISALRKNFE